MPTTIVTGPDGSDYEVTHPEGASDADILAYAKQNYGKAAPPEPGAFEKFMGRGTMGLGRAIVTGSAQPGAAPAAPAYTEQPPAFQEFPTPQQVISRGDEKSAQAMGEALKNVVPQTGAQLGATAASIATGGATTGMGFLPGMLARTLGTAGGAALGAAATGEPVGKSALMYGATVPALEVPVKAGAMAVGGLGRFLARYMPGVENALARLGIQKAQQAIADVPRPTAPVTAPGAEVEPAADYAQRLQTAKLMQKTAQAGADARAAEAATTQGQLNALNAKALVEEIPLRDPEHGTAQEMFGSLASNEQWTPTVIPTNEIKTTTTSLNKELAPVIANWKLNPSPQVQQAVSVLEKYLQPRTDMPLMQIKQMMTDIGPYAWKRGDQIGGAMSKLYNAAVKDLQASGEGSAALLLKAQHMYKREITVDTLKQLIERATKINPETMTPDFKAAQVLETLQHPGTTSEGLLMKRLRSALTPGEQQTLESEITRLGLSKAPPAEKMPMPSVGPAPEKVVETKLPPSLQEMVQRFTNPVRGEPFLDSDKVLKLLPNPGETTSNPTTEWLRANVEPAKIEQLKAVFNELSKYPQAGGALRGMMGRMFVYTVLSAGGVKHGFNPAAILGAGVGTEALSELMGRPLPARLIQRAFENQVGRGDITSALGAVSPALRRLQEMRTEESAKRKSASTPPRQPGQP